MKNISNKQTFLLKLELGKIAYGNPRSRANAAEVTIGFRYIEGNGESYFTVTGDIWNRIHTDILCGGCMTQETILEYLPENALLKKVCEVAKKYHLKYFSSLTRKERKEIFEIMDMIMADWRK